MLRVRDIMTTDVVAVNSTTTLREAAELMAERHIGGAPVVDGGVVVGVVSAGDLLAFVAATPGREGGDVDARMGALEDDTDERAGWDDDGDDPPSRFYTERWEDAEADTVARFEAAGAPGAARAWDTLDAHTVGEVMTRALVTLPPTAPATAAAERMAADDVHRVLVMDGGVLHGLVTTTDLARAVADGRVARRTYVFPPR